MFFMHKSTVKIDAASQVTVVVDRASREQLLVCNPCLKGMRCVKINLLLPFWHGLHGFHSFFFH